MCEMGISLEIEICILLLQRTGRPCNEVVNDAILVSRLLPLN